LPAGVLPARSFSRATMRSSFIRLALSLCSFCMSPGGDKGGGRELSGVTLRCPARTCRGCTPQYCSPGAGTGRMSGGREGDGLQGAAGGADSHGAVLLLHGHGAGGTTCTSCISHMGTVLDLSGYAPQGGGMPPSGWTGGTPEHPEHAHTSSGPAEEGGALAILPRLRPSWRTLPSVEPDYHAFIATQLSGTICWVSPAGATPKVCPFKKEYCAGVAFAHHIVPVLEVALYRDLDCKHPALKCPHQVHRRVGASVGLPLQLHATTACMCWRLQESPRGSVRTS
jgi:hypothetical protein